MPRRPEGQKRPVHAIGNAIMIATGEIEDIITEDGKYAAAGARHGLREMSAKKRSETAKAAQWRWKK